MRETQSKELLKTLKLLQKTKIVEIFESKKSLFWYNFYIGMARGLGTVVGATIVVAVLVFLLNQLQWAPLIGNFIRSLLEFLEQNQTLPTSSN